MITSHDHLAKELKLSRQNIRTALKNLVKTKEVEVNSTKLYTLVTIVNYDAYQSNDMYTNQELTNVQPSGNQELTTTKEVNKVISEESIVIIESAKEFSLTNEVWCNAIKNNMKISEEQFQGYIQEFTAHATMTGKTVISPKEYKEYFLRWYKKRTGKGFKGRSIIRQPKQFL